MSKTNGKNGRLVVINADKTRQCFEFKPGHQPALETLQSLVGGYIERLTVTFEGKKHEAYVDEEGLRKRLKFNRDATIFAGHPHTIVGTMLIWIP